MLCPDCESVMRKHGVFYTCSRCGLSFKPWEVEAAKKRAKDEIKRLEEVDPERAREAKNRRRRNYRNWYEGKELED